MKSKDFSTEKAKALGWMDHLRVQYKLLFLGIITVAGMIIVGCSGFFGIRSAQHDLDRMYTSSVQGIDYASSALTGMRYAQSMTVTTMTIRNDPTRLQEVKGKYENGAKSVDENFQSLANLPGKSGEISSLYEKSAAEWKELHAVLEQSVALSVSGRQEEANAYYSANGSKKAAALGKDLAQLAELERQGAETINEENDAGLTSTMRSIVLEILVVLVVMMAACVYTTKKITQPIKQIQAACSRMEEGDFTEPDQQPERGDEFGDMMRSFHRMRGRVAEILKSINESAQQLAASSQELTASANQSAQASDQVAQSVTNAAQATGEQHNYVDDAQTSIENMGQSISALGVAAANVAEGAETANGTARKGSQSVSSAVVQIEGVAKVVTSSASTVDELGRSSEEIGTIVAAISDIAEQTNLLALNAAIEAARAGEHGRGFAVVADEVGKLAEQSQEAAGKITSLIEGIQGQTKDAVASMQQGSEAVTQGTAAVRELERTFKAIQQAAQGVQDRAEVMSSELRKVTQETGNIRQKAALIAEKGKGVASEMESVSASSEEQSATAGEIASASGMLANLAQELQGSLQKFRY